jgi:hypothetical protein
MHLHQLGLRLKIIGCSARPTILATTTPGELVKVEVWLVEAVKVEAVKAVETVVVMEVVEVKVNGMICGSLGPRGLNGL